MSKIIQTCIHTKGIKSSKIEDDGYGLYLQTNKNGFQWQSVPIDDDMIDLILLSLLEYKSNKNKL